MSERARERGVVLGVLEPGEDNAITDVAHVRVGHTTLHVDDDACVRTGVTAVIPHGRNLLCEPVPAAVAVINAFGKAVGTTQVEELGMIETPIVLTNTFSVGAAYSGVVRHALRGNIAENVRTLNPLVFECNDGWLNEIGALRVTPDHVLAAIDAAVDGPVLEGAVGAGTGMLCFGWKGGIGTASRRAGDKVVGALVLANFGSRDDLVIGGVPVGRLLADPRPEPTRVNCVGSRRARNTASAEQGRSGTTAPVITRSRSRHRTTLPAPTAPGWIPFSSPPSRRWRRQS